MRQAIAPNTWTVLMDAPTVRVMHNAPGTAEVMVIEGGDGYRWVSVEYHQTTTRAALPDGADSVIVAVRP